MAVNPFQPPLGLMEPAVPDHWGPRRLVCALLCGLSLLWAIPISAFGILSICAYCLKLIDRPAEFVTRLDDIRIGFLISATLIASLLAFASTLWFGREKLAVGNGYLVMSVVVWIATFSLIA